MTKTISQLLSDSRETFAKNTKSVSLLVIEEGVEYRVTIAEEKLKDFFETRQKAEISFDRADTPRIVLALGESVECDEATESIIEAESKRLDEGKAHNPFTNRKKIGKGPRGGTNAEKKDWECTSTNYVTVCKGIGAKAGQTKRFTIDKSYKKSYNRLYRAWSAKKKKSSDAGKKGAVEKMRAKMAAKRGARAAAARKGAKKS